MQCNKRITSNVIRMTLPRENNYLFPELVLHEICDFLNLSELKAFRLVCVRWYFVTRSHIQNRAQLTLSTLDHKKFKQFALWKQSGRYSPVQNLKIALCPISVGCNCFACHNSQFYTETPKNHFRKFDETTLHKIIEKFFSGINSFSFEMINDRSGEYLDHKFTLSVERLLLREEFKILRNLCVNVPFRLTPHSGINSVFRNLTTLHLSYLCGQYSFAENVFKSTCVLKSLTIGLFIDEIGNHDHPRDVSRGIASILYALKKANDEKKSVFVEALKIDSILYEFNLYLHESLFKIISDSPLKLKILHFTKLVDIRRNTAIFQHDLQNILLKQKDNLESLVLPYFWTETQTEVTDFPQMNNLKELHIDINFKLPLMQLHEKLPVLNSLKIRFMRVNYLKRFSRVGHVLQGAKQFADQFTENNPPCPTVKELDLYSFRNVKILPALSKMFPNVEFLKIHLKSEDLPTFWRLWPNLKELTLTVEYDDNISEFRDSYRVPSLNCNFLDPSKFNAGLIGMPVNECEALIESSVPFLSLKMESYDYNLPSIRDLTELTKLTLDCPSTCNIALMLGILPLKRLAEVNIRDGNFTVDCAQYILNCSPDINRWEFKGTCNLHPYFNDCFCWKISSRENIKTQPTFWSEFDNKTEYYEERPSPKYITRFRSFKQYGRGRCLYWTCYYDNIKIKM